VFVCEDGDAGRRPLVRDALGDAAEPADWHVDEVPLVSSASLLVAPLNLCRRPPPTPGLVASLLPSCPLPSLLCAPLSLSPPSTVGSPSLSPSFAFTGAGGGLSPATTRSRRRTQP